MANVAIVTENLGKQYVIGETWYGRTTLRERIAGMMLFPWRQWRRLAGYSKPSERVWALKNVELSIPHGKAIGIIGSNGSGKSTLLKILSRITPPTEGRARIHGRVASLLEVGTGFHPELSGRENIYLNGSIMGMKRSEVRRKFDAIVDFADIERFIDTPVKRYSSGMYVRLAFSVAAHLESDILAVDEVLAVGDQAFQSKCMGRMDGVARSGRTVLFVSHNLRAVRTLCDWAYQLDQGRLVRSGHPREVVGAYLESTSSEGSERVWSADAAPGNADVRLLAVRAHSAEGLCGGSFLTSREVYLESELMINSLAEGLTIGFDVVTPDGITVLSSFYTHCGLNSNLSLHLGVNRIGCRIPGKLLNKGSHFVGIRVAITNIHDIVSEGSVIRFEAIQDHCPPSGWKDWTRGVVAPNLDWFNE